VPREIDVPAAPLEKKEFAPNVLSVDSGRFRTINRRGQTSEVIMKFYNATAPNPRRVRIFLAEKGIDIPRVDLDLQAGDNRTPEFRRLNSLGQVPVLELNDGGAITESMAICRYIEELHPDPSLFGTNARERAQVEMWNGRMTYEIFLRIGNVALNTLPFFATRRTQFPAFAEAERKVLPEKWAWLDTELADGRLFISGDSFSVADITGMTASWLGEFLQIEIPAGLTNVRRWDERVRGRASWSA
jgi:glutathione S-transferase